MIYIVFLIAFQNRQKARHIRATFKILFFVNRSKTQFSCRHSVAVDMWDTKANKVKGKSKEARDINFALDNIKAQLIKHYQRISDRETFVTAEMVRNAYQGIGTEYETLIQAFDKHNSDFPVTMWLTSSDITSASFWGIKSHEHQMSVRIQAVHYCISVNIPLRECDCRKCFLNFIDRRTMFFNYP